MDKASTNMEAALVGNLYAIWSMFFKQMARKSFSAQNWNYVLHGV